MNISSLLHMGVNLCFGEIKLKTVQKSEEVFFFRDSGDNQPQKQCGAMRSIRYMSNTNVCDEATLNKNI